MQGQSKLSTTDWLYQTHVKKNHNLCAVMAFLREEKPYDSMPEGNSCDSMPEL